MDPGRMLSTGCTQLNPDATGDPISIPHEDIPSLSDGLLDFRSTSVGRVLFVACDGERTPYRLAEKSIPDSIRCIVVQNVPSVIILATRLEVDPGLVGIVQQVLGPYILRDTIVKAFERDAQRGPLENLHTTDARESSGAHVVRRVIDRLELWKRLEHPDVNRRLWPFHSGLREYLLLTCFDQLGEASNWMSDRKSVV